MADENPAPESVEPEAKSGSILRIALMAALVVIGGVGGHVLHRMVRTPAPAGAEELPDEDPSQAEYQYYEFEPLTATLNTPQKNRYLRATITLTIRGTGIGRIEPNGGMSPSGVPS